MVILIIIVKLLSSAREATQVFKSSLQLTWNAASCDPHELRRDPYLGCNP